MNSWIPVRGVDIDLTEAQELANIDAKTLVGLMDTGVLPYRLVDGVRYVKKKDIKSLEAKFERLAEEFLAYLDNHQVSPEVIGSIIGKGSTTLFFNWLSHGKEISKDHFS